MKMIEELDKHGGVWDLGTMRLKPYSDPETFHRDIYKIIPGDTVPFKYHNLSGKLTIDKSGGEITISWIGTHVDDPIIHMSISKDNNTGFLVDTNVFELDRNRDFLAGMGLKIGNKEYTRLNMVMLIRLAILCSFGIHHSMVTDAATFRKKVDVDIGKNVQLFITDRVLSTRALTLRVFQRKQHHSLYAKYGNTHSYDAELGTLVDKTAQFNEMYKMICGTHVLDHTREIEKLLNVMDDSSFGDDDIAIVYFTAFNTCKRPKKLYSGENKNMKRLSSANTKDSWISFKKYIISMNMFVDRANEYTDSDICTMMASEYKRNPITYNVLLWHITTSPTTLWDGGTYANISNVFPETTLCTLLGEIESHAELYNITTCSVPLMTQ
jgi:hypothetical protein